MASTDIIISAMIKRKNKTIKSLKKFVEIKLSTEKLDTKLESILRSQISTRTNLSSIRTHFNFTDHPQELNMRLTIFLGSDFELENVLTNALFRNVAFPFNLKVNCYYLCYTPDRDFYLFHPSESTALDYGVHQDEIELMHTIKTKFGDSQVFIENLLNKHENVLSRNGKGIFRSSGFSFLGLVSVELYIKYSLHFTKNYDYVL